jgi:O-antigen/teichoic acid export membrane protein
MPGDNPTEDVAGPKAAARRRHMVPVVALAMLVANASNYGFQVLTGRFLSLEQYGVLGSFMSLVSIATVSATALQTSAARSFALGEVDRSRSSIFDRLTKSAILVSLCAGLLILLAGRWATTILQLPTAAFAALSIYVTVASLDSIAAGRFQGQEQFDRLGIYAATQAITKLGLSAGLLIVGVRVVGVLYGLVIGSGVVAVGALVASRRSGALSSHALGRDARLGFAGFTLLWMALSADVVAIKASLSGREAGLYAAGAVFGKAVLWVPAVVAQFVFPQLAKQAGARGSMRTLTRAATLIAAIALVSVVGLILLGGKILRLLYGERYAGASSIAWQIGVATLPFVMVQLLLQDYLARSDARFVIPMLAVTAVELCSFAFVPASMVWYIVILGGSGIAMALVLVMLGSYRKRQS